MINVYGGFCFLDTLTQIYENLKHDLHSLFIWKNPQNNVSTNLKKKPTQAIY